MTDFKKPVNPADFAENFQQLHPIMTDSQAHYESSRCLFCYDAPCVTACPTGIDIPLFIRQINTGNATGASKTIYESNWMGNICGKVCPTEVLCEGACVYNHQEVKPIEIGRLQSYANSRAIENNAHSLFKAPSNGLKIAVIGAGPAGISAACELSSLGYEVTIFEGREKPSGLALHGVAPYKITNLQILQEIEFLQNQLGFDIKYQQRIESAKDFEQIESDFEAIVLAIGLGPTRNLRINGEHLDGCWGAVEFIEELKLNQHQIEVGETVLVLGGGNTAMDAASEACRMGANRVILAYRRSMTSKGAYEFEYELAKGVGAKAVWNITPKTIMGTDKVEAVEFLRTEEIGGKVQAVDGSEFTIPCDMVIKATGQEKQVPLLQKITGLQWDDRGRITTNEGTNQTHNPKYFAAGDALNGGKEVVNAVAEGKKAALDIHEYLTQRS